MYGMCCIDAVHSQGNNSCFAMANGSEDSWHPETHGTLLKCVEKKFFFFLLSIFPCALRVSCPFCSLLCLLPALPLLPHDLFLCTHPLANQTLVYYNDYRNISFYCS